jgi:hypothetical protein
LDSNHIHRESDSNEIRESDLENAQPDDLQI